MWRIIALDKDAREVARVELTAGEVTIGRDPDRQLQLNSASVSRRHARIVANGAQLLVFDDGSANGIMVNGNRVGTPTPVDARSKIEIADFRIVVESTAAAEATPSVAPFATASVAESLRLVAQGGPYDARVFPVIGDVMVGRAAENQLVLDDPSLSRKHAKLRGTGHRLEVEDQGSSNGTFVNGRKVGRAAAGPGDTIRFGELAFRIEDERGMGRPSNDGGFGSLLALVGGGGVTIIILITAMVVTLRKPPILQASGKDAIAKIAKQAEQHLKAGKARFDEKKWVEAKSELDATIELDPANVEARRMKAIAAHAPEDERELGSALNALGAGDRRSRRSRRRCGCARRSYRGRRRGSSSIRSSRRGSFNMACSVRARATTRTPRGPCVVPTSSIPRPRAPTLACRPSYTRRRSVSRTIAASRRVARRGERRVTRVRATTAPARFLDRLRDALGHYAEGVHLLGDAAHAETVAARSRALGRALPASFVEIYGYADGIDLFGDLVRVVRLDALEVDGGWLRCGEAEGGRLLCAPDGAIFEEDEDGDRLYVAADLESALLVYLAREGLIVDHEGEYREVFGTDGAITDAVQRKRNEAARKRAPGAARWIVEQAELKLELDGDEAAAEALLAEARALDPQARR